MSNKKNILIWANCQGGSVKYMIDKYYSDIFDINSLLNYEFIYNKLPVPDEISSADIFLYQNYSDKPNSEYDINTLINKYLKKDCIKISFPTLHSCPLLFCYDTSEPNNCKTINTTFPHGKFYYGISKIQELIKNYDYTNVNKEQKNIIIDEIYNKTQEEDFISEEQIKYYYNRNFEFLENKILQSDTPELLEFIKENFTKVRLWHNPNHPTGILLHELAKNIFKKLNLIYNENDNLKNINELDNFLKDWVIPIFPSVKKYYNMQFDDRCSSWFHDDISNSKNYITKYLNELYFTNSMI
jgi:hypothetical protein